MTARTTALCRLGRRTLEPSAARLLRRVTVTIASMSVVLATCVLTLLWTGAEASLGQRGGIAVALDGLGPRHARSYLTAVDHHPVTVVDIYGQGAEGVPPADLGLRAYPEPGEAVLSPRLRRLAGPAGSEHFGRVAGEIARSGLTDPDELRVYVGRGRPLTPPSSDPPFQPSASALYSAPLSQKLLGVAALWLTPSLIAVAAAGALGGRAAAQRERVLAVLGARRRDRVWVHASEDLLPLGLGLAIAAPVALALAGPGVTVPLLDLHIGGLLPRHRWPIYPLVAVGAVLACFLILQAGRRRAWRGSRARHRLPTGQAYACVGVVIAVSWPSDLELPPSIPTLMYLVGLVVAVLLLPALLVVLVSSLGYFAVTFGQRRGRAAALLAGRSLEARAQQIGRSCAVVGVLVVILGQAQLWSSALGDRYDEATATQRDLGSTVLAADRPSSSPREWRALSSTLDQAGGLVLLSSDLAELSGSSPALTARLEGSCQALEALGLACREGVITRDELPEPVLDLLRWVAPGNEVDIRPTSPDDAPQHDAKGLAVLVSLDGGALDARTVNRLSWAVTQPGITFEPLGESWVVPATVLKEHASVSVLLALCGLLVLAIAIGAVVVTHALATSADLVPLTAMSGRSGGWLVGVFLLRCALPLTVSALVGAAIYMAMPTALRAGQSAVAPSATLAGCAVLMTVVIGCAQALWATRVTAKAVGSWRPGAVPRR